MNCTNTPLLKSRMIIENDSVSELSKALGKNRQNVSIKLNNKREFKQSEIAFIAKRYKLTPPDIYHMFFEIEI